MVARIQPGDEVFLDSSYAIALSSPTDQHYTVALALATQLRAAKTTIVTTRAVMLEIGNAMSRFRYRSAGVRLLQAIEADPTVEIIPISEALYHQSFDLYASRNDKEWGLIDCSSFIVMAERSISKALTADEHFEQAGFHALLQSRRI